MIKTFTGNCMGNIWNQSLDYIVKIIPNYHGSDVGQWKRKWTSPSIREDPKKGQCLLSFVV